MKQFGKAYRHCASRLAYGSLTGRLLRQGFLYTHISQVEFVGGGSFRRCAAVTQVGHARRHSGGARFSTILHGRVEPFRRTVKALHADAVRSRRLWTIVIVKALGDMCEPRPADSTMHRIAGVLRTLRLPRPGQPPKPRLSKRSCGDVMA